MTRWSILSLVLAGCCACSAVAVAWSQHLSRAAWADISVSRRAIDELEVQWTRLQIEQSTFSEHGRIERAATERLGMAYPVLARSKLIVRSPAGAGQ